MVSDKFNCVFVHIPKTAGQSIEHFFLELHGLDWKQRDTLLISNNDDPARGPERLAHMRAHEYVDCGHMSQQQYDQAFSFAFVRNPWQRLVSEYLHKKIDKHMSLKQFVMEGFPQANDFSDKYRHVIPQMDYLTDKDGKQIVDFVGRFENLQQDFTQVCDRLGITDSTLKHANSSYSPRRAMLRKLRHLFSKNDRVKKHYTEYYDDELKQHVAQMYQQDIDTFGYTFAQ